jgi:hypothetical protein
MKVAVLQFPGQNYARDLGNRPGNICFPEYLADQAIALAAQYPDLLKVTILNEQQMADLGMNAFLAVSKRSYDHAEMLLKIGVGTPQPVGYMNIRSGLLFDKSYYISLLSTCPYIYDNLFTQQFDYAEEVFRAIGKVTARLHEHGYAHKDYGRANILFQKTPNGITIEIVDLNRMYIGPIDMKTGCKNFERLPATPQMHRWMAEEYAKARNFDVEKCFELMRAYRSVQPGKIDNLY